MPHHIGLLVTGAEAAADFQIFVRTLEVWHADAHLYVFTDSATDLSKIKFKGVMHIKVALDAYKGLTRKMMESMPGRVYDSLFKDYTYEKAAVLEWMFEAQPAVKIEGAWFMDADITHLAPLPGIPGHATVALSPHYIRDADCRLYGKYNAGYMWVKDPSLIQAWKEAAPTSRFFEQAALEHVASVAAGSLYEFPIQVNYGWWRMFQSSTPPPLQVAKFSFHRGDTSVGLRYDGAVLHSVHTHWSDMSTSATGAFNKWFMEYTKKFASHKPLAQFRRSLIEHGK